LDLSLFSLFFSFLSFLFFSLCVHTHIHISG
jgi:hypothetical protein